MKTQPNSKRSATEVDFDEEIDLMELLHFVIKGVRFWIGGVLIAGVFALIYVLIFYPTIHRQQTLNDIGLNQERLALIREMIPAMTAPLKSVMEANQLEDLYEAILKNPDFLDKTIIGLSGIDIKDRNNDKELKNKIDSVRIQVKGKDKNQMQKELAFIRNSIRGVSQYLAVKQYLDNEARESKLQLFTTEAQVNGQQLNYERAERQLQSYQELQKQPNQQKDLQIILNLSNNEERIGDKRSLNSITEFTGAKYLPLGNRIVALKSEMADQQEAINISHEQIKALKLSQSVLSQLNDAFQSIDYRGNVIDLQPLIEVVHHFREALNSNYTREEIAALDNLEKNLISFERDGLKFNNNLPAIYEQKGRGLMVVLSLVMGAFFGFMLYVIQALTNRYQIRYSKWPNQFYRV